MPLSLEAVYSSTHMADAHKADLDKHQLDYYR